MLQCFDIFYTFIDIKMYIFLLLLGVLFLVFFFIKKGGTVLISSLIEELSRMTLKFPW